MRENVTSLRCKIEKLEIIKEDAIQKAVSTQQREINHFKSMVNALRDEIDLKKNLHEQNLQKKNQIKTMEFKDLQATIIELRAELEDTNAR